MEQKIYPLEEHQISHDRVDADALYVMEKLQRAGFTAYLVGGGVRDLLLQRKPKDFDISTSAEPEEIRKLFRNCILIGRRFRLAHIRFGQKVLEVSTFRSGDIENDALIIRDNKWGSPEEDVLRRDFTINGLFYDPATETVIDYVGGYADLQKKYLRTIGQPYVRFKQDPVRMLRLIKFQARFGFDIDPHALISLLECRAEILKSSPARIQEELLRMLESGAATHFFQSMVEHGLLQLLLPSLGAYLESAKGDEIYSYLEEIDVLHLDPARPTYDRATLLACLVFPILNERIEKKAHHLPHLGEIYKEAQDVVDELFGEFFQLSRRMKSILLSILTTQYRFTPLEKKKKQRHRIPRDPDFIHALHFFEIRFLLEPALQSSWQQWQPSLEGHTPAPPSPRRRRRRPPRRR